MKHGIFYNLMLSVYRIFCEHKAWSWSTSHCVGGFLFRSQTPCVLATWSSYVRTEPSVCFSPWSVTGSNTARTVLMRMLGMLDVVRNAHMPITLLMKVLSHACHGNTTCKCYIVGNWIIVFRSLGTDVDTKCEPCLRDIPPLITCVCYSLIPVSSPIILHF